MIKNKKGRSCNFGPKTNLNGYSRKAFSVRYVSPFCDGVQCEKCGSDYMRFSVDGYCQGCQQLVEYVIREQLAAIVPAKAGREIR